MLSLVLSASLPGCKEKAWEPSATAHRKASPGAIINTVLAEVNDL